MSRWSHASKSATVTEATRQSVTDSMVTDVVAAPASRVTSPMKDTASLVSIMNTFPFSNSFTTRKVPRSRMPIRSRGLSFWWINVWAG